jgi:hypothetical protein
MRYRIRTLLIVLAVALPLMGCGQRSIPAVAPTSDPLPPAVPPAKYVFEVRTEDGSTQQPASGNADLTIGKVHLRVQDGAFTVNGRPYGQLRDGDTVLVHADGQVLVNSQVRSPL